GTISLGPYYSPAPRICRVVAALRATAQPVLAALSAGQRRDPSMVVPLRDAVRARGPTLGPAAGVPPQDADDLVQPVCLDVCRGIAGLQRDRGSFTAGVDTTARNRVIDYHRRQGGQPEAVGGIGRFRHGRTAARGSVAARPAGTGPGPRGVRAADV